MGEEIWFSMAGEKAVEQTGAEFSDVGHIKGFVDFYSAAHATVKCTNHGIKGNEEEVKLQTYNV